MGRPVRRRGAVIDRLADVEAVRSANQAFYEAFEAESMDRMERVWEHSDRVTCVHPGWRLLRGWPAVAESWEMIFAGPTRLQFILTDEQVEVDGSVAWVTVDENLISGAGGGGTVTAVNLFVRGDEGWRMVGHHGSAVQPTVR